MKPFTTFFGREFDATRHGTVGNCITEEREDGSDWDVLYTAESVQAAISDMLAWRAESL